VFSLRPALPSASLADYFPVDPISDFGSGAGLSLCGLDILRLIDFQLFVRSEINSGLSDLLGQSCRFLEFLDVKPVVESTINGVAVTHPRYYGHLAQGHSNL